MQVQTDFSFSAESYVPEGHPYYELDFEFSVLAHTIPYSPQTWQEPACGGGIEDIRGTLTDYHNRTPDEIELIEKWFAELVVQSRKLRDAIQEQLGQEYVDEQNYRRLYGRPCRGYDD